MIWAYLGMVAFIMMVGIVSFLIGWQVGHQDGIRDLRVAKRTYDTTGK